MRNVAKVKQISFKNKEYPVLIKQMNDLMEVFQLDMSGLYKNLLREKHKEIFGTQLKQYYKS